MEEQSPDQERQELSEQSQLHALPDPILQILVDVVNGEADTDRGGQYVTLTVGGNFISGRLIPAWAFFDNYASLPGMPADHWSRRLADEYKGFARVRGSLADTAPEDYSPEQEREASRVMSFVHLAEARAFAPGAGPTPAVGTYWRGRLSHVSGWIFGVLGTDASQE